MNIRNSLTAESNGEHENLGHSELLHTMFPKGNHNQILKVTRKLAWAKIMRAKRSRCDVAMCRYTDANCGGENMKTHLMYPEWCFIIWLCTVLDYTLAIFEV